MSDIGALFTGKGIFEVLQCLKVSAVYSNSADAER